MFCASECEVCCVRVVFELAYVIHTLELSESEGFGLRLLTPPDIKGCGCLSRCEPAATCYGCLEHTERAVLRRRNHCA